LEGKVAVISGGTSGIGLAIAQRFVKEGVHVFTAGLSL
jgi:NAD(P)-dependent dehydrogenase (short-subunit alcohol dehydrogenase family)